LCKLYTFGFRIICHLGNTSTFEKKFQASVVSYFVLFFPGIQCEKDVDECLSLPCQNNATCIDGVDTYNCHCAEGFQGTLCETEINECNEFLPCANNATCFDLVADYSCTCQSTLSFASQVLYGGRNCSVALVGCQRNACENGATCRPVLIDERTNNQSYVCDCMSGYYGTLCSVATAVSFLNSDAWIRFDSAVVTSFGGAHVGLQFRTTISG